jgi:hypothetical protein
MVPAHPTTRGRIANEDDYGWLLRFGQDCIGEASVIGAAPPNDQPQISDAATVAALDVAHTKSGVKKSYGDPEW